MRPAEPSKMDDADLLRRSESCSLPKKEWTHHAHVKVAFLFLRDLPFPQALVRVRNGIQALNAAHGVVESPTSGYNETTTQAFLA